MPLSALSFLLDPKVLLRAGLLVIFAVLALKVFNFIEDSIAARERVIEQELTIKLKNGEIVTLNGRIKQMEEAQGIALEAAQETEALEAELEAIRRDILSAGDDRDGPIAPVLADTLCAIRALNGGVCTIPEEGSTPTNR